MLQLVSRDEIKATFFDIAEDKAPGPDGYSSGFFKAVWPIVGEEMIKAIMEFFHFGKILKQLNATLITLIPKVQLPSNVAEYRPISCCNVLYKVITKILVQRMKNVMNLIVRIAQNAFVPGLLVFKEGLDWFSGVSGVGFPRGCDAPQIFWYFISPLSIDNSRMSTFTLKGGQAYCRMDWGLQTMDMLRWLSPRRAYDTMKEGKAFTLLHQIRSKSIWTVSLTSGSWSWQKMIKLRHLLLNDIRYEVDRMNLFTVWHDPWHPRGVLIHKFPRGPSIIGVLLDAQLDVVMHDEQWHWPPITNLEMLDIIDDLPPIHFRPSRIRWNSSSGTLTNF
ncbi:hypothetical protein Sango_2423000 [Sesamum angolense]|uniref:Uncharacterized protein n=1 Tax=Sesamum angolense TaxID=2727404 RepID=A0AAE1W7J6_9LAMI|nr:hypothetical protein Sango_2423000 [Sesamum angolense]